MRHLVAKLVIQTNSLPSVFTFLSFDTKELSRLIRILDMKSSEEPRIFKESSTMVTYRFF